MNETILSPISRRAIQRAAIFLTGLGAVFSGCSRESPDAKAPTSHETHAAEDTAATETPSTGEKAPQIVVAGGVEASGSFLPPLLDAVTSFGAATTGTALYVLGGYSGTPHEYSKEGQSNDVWKLDLRPGGKWDRVASLSQGLKGLAAVHHSGKICHFGGNHASNEAGTEARMESVKAARCLHLSSGEWTDLPPLPLGRSSHGATVIDDKAYVVGGWTLSGAAKSGRFVDDVLALDLAERNAKWLKIASPFSRRAVGVAGTSNKLFVVGGMTSDGNVSNEVDVYDIQAEKWEKGPKYPGDAFGIAVTSHGGIIYASGRDGVLRSLKPGQTKWETVRQLAFGRFFHEMRVVGERLVIVGGIGGMHTRGRTRVVEAVPLDASLTYGQLSFTTPGSAKNRQGFLLEGDQLYFFGGNLSLEQHDFERQHFASQGWKLDLATLQFIEAAPYPFRRQSMQSVETAEGGLALGGFGHEPLEGTDTEAISQKQVFSYSWQDNTWAAAGEFPRGRTQFGLTRSSGKIWIFGGLNYDPHKKNAFDHDQSIWVSDEKKLSFQVLDVALPGPRRAFAGAELGGKYYLVGGMKENFQLVEDCLEFDFKAKEFEIIPCPSPRLSGDLVPAGGKLYLVGGSIKTKDGIEESRAVEMFDPESRSWTKVDFEIPMSTRHMRAMAYREQILLVSTYFEARKMTVALLSP